MDRIESIEGGGFTVQTVCLPHGHPTRTHQTRTVLLTTGLWGQPRRLQVPGADLPHVLGRYNEPICFWRKRVLIAGTGNSAGEAAIRLSDADAYVWLAIETESLEQARFRPFILREIQLRVEENRLTPLFQTQIECIEPTCVHLTCLHDKLTLSVDFVLALVGLEVETRLIAPLGVPLDEQGKPLHDPETYETPVPGLYVGGAISRDGFIYTARERVGQAIRTICQRVRTPQ